MSSELEKKYYIYLYIILKIWLCGIVINNPVLQNLKGQNWVLAVKSELEMWQNLQGDQGKTKKQTFWFKMSK